MGRNLKYLTMKAAGTRLPSTEETDRAGAGTEGTSARSSSTARTASSPSRTRSQRRRRPDVGQLHPAGRHLLVANYFGGSVAVLPVLAEGRLGPATDVKNDAGKVGSTQATHAPPGSSAINGDRSDARPHDRGRSRGRMPSDSGVEAASERRLTEWGFSASS
jgi:6-phosphogluconolactonase (cycloisomerase 2 family)